MTFSCLSAAATSPVAPRIRGTELLVKLFWRKVFLEK